MSETLKFGAGEWATKKGSTLAYNDTNGNFKPLPFTFDRSTSATRVNKEGLIETVGSGIPRIDFLGNTKGALLLEPSRSNAITNSETFGSTGWSFVTTGAAITPIVTDDYAISPDGTQNAQRVQFNLGGGTTLSDRTVIRQSISSQTDWFLSVYMKSTNGAEQKILWHTNADSNETVVTGEWQRFTFSRNGVTNSWAGLGLRGSTSSVDTADILVYGFQAEQGSYATSYIPTSGQSGGVTRVADNAYQQNVTQVIGQSEGTMFIEFTPKDSSTLQILYQAKSSSGVVGQVDIRLQGGLIRALANDGGGSQFFMNGGSYTVGTKYKVAVRYKLNDSKLYINGTDTASDTTCSFTSSSLDQVSFADSLSSFLPSVDIVDSRLYNTALTDAELQALTTI